MDSSDVAKNRAFWDKESVEYQRRNAAHIDHPDTRWGPCRLTDPELDALGESLARTSSSSAAAPGSAGWEPPPVREAQ
jgi:hypothetical protein